MSSLNYAREIMHQATSEIFQLGSQDAIHIILELLTSYTYGSMTKSLDHKRYIQDLVTFARRTSTP